MLRFIRKLGRAALSLPAHASIGVVFALIFFGHFQSNCDWLACTVYYNLNKPHVIASLILAGGFLSSAVVQLIRRLVTTSPTLENNDMPAPIKESDLTPKYWMPQVKAWPDDFTNDA